MVFFHFEDTRLNLALYFLISTIVLYLGPGFFVPSLDPTRGVPIINTESGRVRGIKMKSRDDRTIFAYKGLDQLI